MCLFYQRTTGNARGFLLYLGGESTGSMAGIQHNNAE